MPTDLLDAAELSTRLAGLASRVEVVEAVGSTSSALIDAARTDPDAWPDRSILVADHQQAGRGRAGRTWTTPPGVALTVSVLLRPQVPRDRWGWVPMIGGLAVARALRDLGAPAVLKWPNDVLLPVAEELPDWGPYRKVAGVLADLTAAPDPCVVLGIGINVHQSAADLPVPSATSLAEAGVRTSRTEVLVGLLARLVALDVAWREAGGTGPAQEWTELAITPGQRVSVQQPGRADLTGTALGLADDGGLRVADGSTVVTVHAGDVRVRREAPHTGPSSD